MGAKLTQLQPWSCQWTLPVFWQEKSPNHTSETWTIARMRLYKIFLIMFILSELEPIHHTKPRTNWRHLITPTQVSRDGIRMCVVLPFRLLSFPNTYACTSLSTSPLLMAKHVWNMSSRFSARFTSGFSEPLSHDFHSCLPTFHLCWKLPFCLLWIPPPSVVSETRMLQTH